MAEGHFVVRGASGEKQDGGKHGRGWVGGCAGCEELCPELVQRTVHGLEGIQGPF